jgi:predicted DNA-binding transcriptional regulator AlpA
VSEDAYLGFASDLMSTQEFAEKAGVTRQWLHKLWQDGKIEFEPVRVANRLLWQSADVEGWIDRHR